MARPVSKIPTLTQREGVFYANWYDPARCRTKRLSLATRDESEAKARFAAFLTDGADLRGGAGADVKIAGAVIDAYLDEHVERRVADARRWRNLLANIRAHFGDRDISELVEEDFEDYAAKRRKGAVGNPAVDSTIGLEIRAFKAAVSHAVKRKRVDSRSTPIWWTPPAGSPACDKFLTRGEIDQLLGAATSRRVENFIHLAYWTAGRQNAVRLLQANRIDVDRRRIDLHPPSWPRTKKRNPVVPIADELETPLVGMLMFASGSDYVVERPTVAMNADFNATAKAAGLEEKGATPHWLRHSRATHLLQAGKSLWHVAGLLGDTVTTVERTYGHHCLDNLREHLA